MARIKSNELMEAYRRWHEVWAAPGYPPCGWTHFIGSKALGKGLIELDDGALYWEVSDTTAARIHMLNSPHYHTLLKAWAAKHVPVPLVVETPDDALDWYYAQRAIPWKWSDNF